MTPSVLEDLAHLADSALMPKMRQQLTWVLNQRDLTAPVIATPREIVRKFFR